MFNGNLIRGNDTIPTLLELDHITNKDEGTFRMMETIKGPDGKPERFTTPGNWDVQAHQLHENEDDARVVALNGEGQEFQMFLVRRNDSTLQKLDATYHEMDPASFYTLSKVRGKTIEKNTLTEQDNTMMKLSGNYKGKLPCADCNAINTTLTLRFKAHAKSGDYTLSDKYLGTKNGDITNDRKGKWSYISKLIEADHKTLIIVLDPDKRGRETYYFVKRDGIIQVDHNLHRIESPTDQTLRK